MRAALYIDGNSTEEKMIPAICDEIHRSDDIVIRKIFGGDIGRKVLKRCRLTTCAVNYDTIEEQKVAMAVDIIIDMEQANVDRVYIAASDTAFIPVVEKLNLDGVDTVLIGRCDTPRTLVEAGNRFIYTEVVAGGKCTAAVVGMDEIAREIYSVSSYYKSIGSEADASQVYEGIMRKYPDFEVRNYGYTHFATLVQQNVPGTIVQTDESDKLVIKVIDDRDVVEKFIYTYMTEKKYKIDDMAELFGALEAEFPGFAIENYGYHSDYGFILSFSKLSIYGNKGVQMKRTFKLSEKSAQNQL